MNQFKVSFMLVFTCVFVLCKQVNAQGCSQTAQVNLGNDTTLCAGENLVLSIPVSAGYDNVVWDNNSTALNRVITTPGTYYVETSVIGDNLIVNGDFEQGNTNFSTGYIVGTGGTWGQLSFEGTYAISSSPSFVHNNFQFCNDHTPNPGTNQMVVNGSGTPGIEVWCQTINVDPNTDYQFSTWATSVINSTNVAQLQFSINGAPLGNIFSPTSSACDYTQFFEEWNSTTLTSVEVCITNLNVSNSGNDFAIDDIYFAPICTSKDTIVVNYLNSPVFTLPTNYDACDGETITLDAENPGFEYTWTSSNTDQHEDVTVTGSYTVEVENPGGLCGANQTFNVTFHDQQNAGTDSTLAFCNTENQVNLNNLLNPSIDHSGFWIDEENNPVSNGITSILMSQGIETYKYLLESQFCPSDTAIFILDVKHFESAGSDFSSHVCNSQDYDLAVFLNATAQGNWESLTNLSPQIFNTQTGLLVLDSLFKGEYIFHYIIQNETPCVNDTAVFEIEVSEIPNIQFTSDTIAGCSPLVIHFSDLTNVQGDKTYQWFVDGAPVGNDSLMSFTFENADSYDVGLEMQIDNMCLNAITNFNYITVHPGPIANFNFSPTTVYSNNPQVIFTNTSTLNAFNNWNFANLGSSQEVNPVFQFPVGTAGDYLIQLKVVSEHNCVDTTERIIPIKSITLFYVPNAFTPDGDEFNNVFKPVMGANFDPFNYHFYVYNRWGQLIFESHDHTVGWDGTYNGKLVQSGEYIWTLKFKEKFSSTFIIENGIINLLK